jgi:hypothetical protein
MYTCMCLCLCIVCVSVSCACAYMLAWMERWIRVCEHIQTLILAHTRKMAKVSRHRHQLSCLDTCYPRR